MHYLPRKPTLLVVSGLCVLQYVWMLAQTRPRGAALVFAIGGIVVFNALFHLLYARGKTLHEAKGEKELEELSRENPGL